MDNEAKTTYKGSAELIEHPVAGSIEPFQVLLQTASLQKTTPYIKLQAIRFPGDVLGWGF
jgi:hypothetical protein